MAKSLDGTERQRVLDAIQQSEAIHRIEGLEPTPMRRLICRAVLDGLATSAELAQQMTEYVGEHKTLEGFIDSRCWWPEVVSNLAREIPPSVWGRLLLLSERDNVPLAEALNCALDAEERTLRD